MKKFDYKCVNKTFEKEDIFFQVIFFIFFIKVMKPLFKKISMQFW